MSTTRCLLLSGLCLALLGCQSASDRSRCVELALEEFPLPGGIAVFADGGRIKQVPHTLPAWLKARRELPAASLTKPIIAREIARLIDAGKLGLDTTLEEALGDLPPDADPRIGQVTVRHLMQHVAGFDRLMSGDPIWREDGNPDCNAAAAAALRKKLDFPSGERIAYSNAGYCLLGEILKHHPEATHADIRRALDSGLGAAGGWSSSLEDLYLSLLSTLPPLPLAPMATLPDGSYYTYGWRYWPLQHRPGAPWTHTGRLPGMVSIALTDGTSKLLVAYFSGDPADWEAASQEFNRKAWQCMATGSRPIHPHATSPS